MATHIAIHYSHLAKLRAGSTVTEAPFGLLVDSGLDCDTFNVVVTSSSDALVSDADVAEVRQQFGGRRFSWWVGPNAPSQTNDVLRDNGLPPGEPEPAMRASLLTDNPNTVGIRRVSSRAELSDYARVLAANWNPPDEDVIRFYSEIADRISYYESPLILLLAHVDGAAVGTAEVTLGDDGVAGLYNVATLESFRRRGVGQALTERALFEAGERGMHVVELQASELGRKVYERVGFVSSGAWHEHQPVT